MNKSKCVMKGYVIKNKMNKSIIVLIDRLVKHKIYGKFIKRKTKIHVHDENNDARIGDLIEINQCKLISKTKSWVLSKIIRRSIL
ncbi:MAG: 30S ribosomal protein S17 [Enterobacterales bacterium]